MKSEFWLGIVLALTTSACSNRPDEPSSAGVISAAPAEAMALGYVHTLSHSKFRPGQAVVESFESGHIRQAGENGMFLTNRATGLVTAAPKPGSPAQARPALTSKGEEHNKRVLDYFVGAGLPADQIEHVQAHATMRVVAEGTDNPKQSPPEFEWYSSVISRQIQGVPIADSFAHARFNVDDEVVSEVVFWPEIPLSIVEEALSLQRVLADPARAAAYRAKLGLLPPGQGTVLIHHTIGAASTPVVARVSYDFVPRTPQDGSILHFDSSGARFKTPEESPPPVARPHRQRPPRTGSPIQPRGAGPIVK